MTTRPGESFVCRVMIGRARELTAIEEYLRSPDRKALIVSGEAGVGKSRLVAEAKRWAEALGYHTVQGGCFEADRAVPYAPLLDMLRTTLTSGSLGKVKRSAGPAIGQLVKLSPELAAVLPENVPAPALDPEQEKRRMFQALSDLLGQLASLQPLLVVIEDLHWSDDTSLEFLLYMAQRIRLQPVWLLVTYRTEEANASLTHLLANLDRERLAIELRLARLTREDVHAMLRAIFAQDIPVTAEFLHAIYALTEGNPFFIEEVLKSLAVTSDISQVPHGWSHGSLSKLPVPRSVQDAVQRRLAHLSPVARQTLVLAAVVGHRFDFGLLQDLTKSAEHELLQHIKELITAQLVVEESAERFAFRHALTRQAVYSELLHRERQKLHLAVAEGIERLYTSVLDTRLSELAYHYFEAGAWAKALYYSQQAGERDQSLYTPRAAVEHFGRALEASRHLGAAPPSKLYRDRGLAHETLGEFESALRDLGSALEIAQSAHDRRAEWQALDGLGRLWAARDYTQTGEYYKRALELARKMKDLTILARSLNRVGNWLVNTGAAEESLKAHHEALDIYQARGDRAGVAETLDLLGMANGIYGDVPRAVEYYKQAVDLFRELGDTLGLASSLSGCWTYASPFVDETTYSALGTVDALERALPEALRLARQAEWAAGQAFVQFMAGSGLAAFGELGRGLECAQEALRTATEIEHRQWIGGSHTHLGQIYVFMLQPIAAIRALEAGRPLARELGSAWWIGYNTTYLVLAYLQQHDMPRAEAVLHETMPRDHVPRNLPERRMTWAWGELSLAKGQPDVALDIAVQLIESAPGSNRAQPIPTLLKLRGEALTAMSRLEEARQSLEEAKRGAQARGARPLLWQIHRSLGRLHQRLKDKEPARREFGAAREIIRSLAATIGDASLRESFTQAALKTLPKETALTPRQTIKKDFAGLTEREREVAVLIAQGKSNRQIADELVVSERTVDTHVGNILSKLSFASRAQIAAWAVEKGLAHRSG